MGNVQNMSHLKIETETLCFEKLEDGQSVKQQSLHEEHHFRKSVA
jgi:hypothetical protein